MHLIVNHLPIIGFIFFVPLIVMACIAHRADYKRLALPAATCLDLLVLPAFWTGKPAEDILERQVGILETFIEQHEKPLELALVGALQHLALPLWVGS